MKLAFSMLCGSQIRLQWICGIPGAYRVMATARVCPEMSSVLVGAASSRDQLAEGRRSRVRDGVPDPFYAGTGKIGAAWP
jgi:hypothetical protein